KAVGSELTGNLIDVCPVGALTSKPYAFSARPWELKKVETIDVMDAVGSNIRMDVRGREVMRILPRTHDDVNEEWLADKSRFVWDGLAKRRLDRPYIREGGKLRAARWDEAFSAIAARLEGTAPERIAAIAGDLVAAEPIKALKDLMEKIGTPHMDCRQDGSVVGRLPNGSPALRGSYTFGPTIAGVDRADAILIIGANPRVEAPLVNARIRKNWLNNTKLQVGFIGEPADLTYETTMIGAGPESLEMLAGGQHSFFDVLQSAERPVIMLGASALARADGHAVMREALVIAEKVGALTDDWRGFGVLHTAAARVGALDLGFLPSSDGRNFHDILEGARSGEIEIVYNLGCDEADLTALSDAFVIYQGHHGDAGAKVADVILPGAAYPEQSGLYANLEGRVQLASRVYFPFGEAKDDWAIIRALSERLDKTLPYDDLLSLRQAMIEDAPSFGSLDNVEPGALPSPDDWKDAGALGDEPFEPAFRNYYLTNPIARASETMANCSSAMMADRAKLVAE
ncbi:MAG: molybdopterin-dependent oxidoreductase, partial [Pseudomonadota bacterium]